MTLRSLEVHDLCNILIFYLFSNPLSKSNIINRDVLFDKLGILIIVFCTLNTVLLMEGELHQNLNKTFCFLRNN